MQFINSKILAILDAIAWLEQNNKKCSKTSVCNHSQLNSEAKKMLEKAISEGYVEYLAGPRAYGLTATGKPIGYNEIDIQVVLDDGHIKANVQIKDDKPEPEKAEKRRVTFTAPKPKADDSEREALLQTLIDQYGFGEVVRNPSECWYQYTGIKGKFKLYPARNGKWTMYVSKNRGFDIELTQLNEYINGVGDVKKAYVSVKDALSKVDIKMLKELLG